MPQPRDVAGWWAAIGPIGAFIVGSVLLVVLALHDDPDATALTIAGTLIATASGLAVNRWLR